MNLAIPVSADDHALGPENEETLAAVLERRLPA
jgi:hypothetical protein